MNVTVALNFKVLLGFLAGAVLASVGSYWLGHRHTAVPIAATAPVSPASAPPVAAPAAASPPTTGAISTAAPARQPGNAVVRKLNAPPSIRETVHTAPEVPASVPSVSLSPEPASEQPKPQEIAAVVVPPAAVVQVAREAPPAANPVTAPSLEKTGIEKKPEGPRSVTIPNGTLLRVRIGEPLSTKRNRAGDTFAGMLEQEIVVDGLVIAERGSRIEGRVAESEQAGRTRGLARLSLELTKIHTSDGQMVSVRTEKFEQTGPTSKTDDWAKVAMGTALGGAIGAAAGGGKGAAVGAAAGAAAGAGTVAVTRGKPAEIAVEARISFKLDQPVVLTEKLP